MPLLTDKSEARRIAGLHAAVKRLDTAIAAKGDEVADIDRRHQALITRRLELEAQKPTGGEVAADEEAERLVADPTAAVGEGFLSRVLGIRAKQAEDTEKHRALLRPVVAAIGKAEAHKAEAEASLDALKADRAAAWETYLREYQQAGVTEAHRRFRALADELLIPISGLEHQLSTLGMGKVPGWPIANYAKLAVKPTSPMSSTPEPVFPPNTYGMAAFDQLQDAAERAHAEVEAVK